MWVCLRDILLISCRYYILVDQFLGVLVSLSNMLSFILWSEHFHLPQIPFYSNFIFRISYKWNPIAFVFLSHFTKHNFFKVVANGKIPFFLGLSSIVCWRHSLIFRSSVDALRLLSFLGYYKQSCYQHWVSCIFSSWCFHFLWRYAEE